MSTASNQAQTNKPVDALKSKKQNKKGKGKKSNSSKKTEEESQTISVDTPFKVPEDTIIPEKDEEELELEKLVFGDVEGFESNLKQIDNLINEDDEDSSEDDRSEDDEDNKIEGLQDDQLFMMDETNDINSDSDLPMIDKAEGNDNDTVDDDESDEEDAAWYDSDDENMNVNLLQSSKIRKLRDTHEETIISSKAFISRLRSQFEKIYPKPLWTEELVSNESDIGDSDESENEPATEDENEDAIDTSNYNSNAVIKLIESNFSVKRQRDKSSKLLTSKNINIARLRDVNYKHVSKSGIQALDFHDDLPLLLTGGYDKTLRIYNVDGKNNNVVTTLHFTSLPIQNAFFASQNRIFLAGRRKFMYKLDLISGVAEKISNLYGIKNIQRSFENFKISPLNSYIGLIGNNGYVNILSMSNGSFVKNFKVDGVVADFQWNLQSDDVLFIVTTSGFVYEFNFNNKYVLDKWQDENGLGITKLAIGGGNNKQTRYIAIGSSNGIVNIYDYLKDKKKPIGVVENLVTSISSLVFNHDGQLLCISSRAKKDSLRLVHIPSCSTYSNWPTSGTPLGKVTAVAFSKSSEMLAVGNEAGKVRLFRLNDY